MKLCKSMHCDMLLIGGGGYTIRNVARCWANETALCIGKKDLSDTLPYNEYYEYFAPDYKLSIEPSDMDNLNPPAYLEQTTQ